MTGYFRPHPDPAAEAHEEVVAVPVVLEPVLEVLVAGAHLRLEDRELAQIGIEIDEEEDDEARGTASSEASRRDAAG